MKYAPKLQSTNTQTVVKAGRHSYIVVTVSIDLGVTLSCDDAATFGVLRVAVWVSRTDQCQVC